MGVIKQSSSPVPTQDTSDVSCQNEQDQPASQSVVDGNHSSMIHANHQLDNSIAQGNSMSQMEQETGQPPQPYHVSHPNGAQVHLMQDSSRSLEPNHVHVMDTSEASDIHAHRAIISHESMTHYENNMHAHHKFDSAW